MLNYSLLIIIAFLINQLLTSCSSNYFGCLANCVLTCLDDYYGNYYNMTCDQCNANCNACISYQNPGCTICKKIKLFRPTGTCVTDCTSNISKCISNFKLSACRSCFIEYIPYAYTYPPNLYFFRLGIDSKEIVVGECLTTVPSGYWDSSKIIERCPQKCAICNGFKDNKCTSCLPGSYLMLILGIEGS